MKVGTDGVLLGAWCTVESGMGSTPKMSRALDIGTGTGLITLMLAQRGEEWGLVVDGVEIEPAAAAEAAANVAASPWSDRVRIVHGDVRELVVENPSTGEYSLAAEAPYDLIVSNPPFFTETLQSPDKARAMARHTSALSPGELIDVAARLLSPSGRFAVILPAEQAAGFVGGAMAAGLKPVRRTDVHTRAGTAAKRSLLEFSFVAANHPVIESIVIMDANSAYTPQYRELTRDFYLDRQK